MNCYSKEQFTWRLLPGLQPVLSERFGQPLCLMSPIGRKASVKGGISPSDLAHSPLSSPPMLIPNNSAVSLAPTTVFARTAHSPCYSLTSSASAYSGSQFLLDDTSLLLISSLTIKAFPSIHIQCCSFYIYLSNTLFLTISLLLSFIPPPPCPSVFSLYLPIHNIPHPHLLSPHPQSNWLQTCLWPLHPLLKALPPYTCRPPKQRACVPVTHKVARPRKDPAISIQADMKTSPTHQQVVLIVPGCRTTGVDMSCIRPLDHPYLKGGHCHAPCTTGPSGPILTHGPFNNPATHWLCSDHPMVSLWPPGGPAADSDPNPMSYTRDMQLFVSLCFLVMLHTYVIFHNIIFSI